MIVKQTRHGMAAIPLTTFRYGAGGPPPPRKAAIAPGFPPARETSRHRASLPAWVMPPALPVPACPALRVTLPQIAPPQLPQVMPPPPARLDGPDLRPSASPQTLAAAALVATGGWAALLVRMALACAVGFGVHRGLDQINRQLDLPLEPGIDARHRRGVINTLSAAASLLCFALFA